MGRTRRRRIGKLREQPVTKAEDIATLAASWEKCAASLDASVEPIDVDARFIDYAWRDFDINTVLKVLTHQSQSYFAHKPVLFAALCAWIVAPKSDILRRSSIVVEVGRSLKEAEKRALKAYPDSKAFASHLGRAAESGLQFYEEIYFPIGGMTRIIDAPSSKNYAKIFMKYSRNAPIAVEIMRIFHHHALRLDDVDRYRIASLSNACEVAVAIRGPKKTKEEVKPDRLNTEKRWRLLRSSAALAYSASTIAAAPFENLLHVMEEGAGSWKHHGHLLEECVRKALYAETFILSKIYKNTEEGSTKLDLPAFAALRIPAPRFGPTHAATIADKFRRSAGSRSVQEEPVQT